MTGPRRARVRKTSRGWTVTRPRYGLGRDETHTAPTHRAALRWLDSTRPAGGVAHPVDAERAQWTGDAVNPDPAWTPLWAPEDRGR